VTVSLPIVLTAWGLLSVAASLVAGSWLAGVERRVARPATAEPPEAVEERVAA
jgi:hypothetical protein